ncbi:MAG: winged helix-turn-helix transcriptional regulator [Sphingomicrobium sp.]
MQLEKVTSLRSGEPKRRYDDACGTAHALELIGDRWTLLVLRELMLGGRRFSELRGDLPGISANTLTQRLTEMERRGLVLRKRLPPPASVQVYEATAWGLEAEPIVQSLGRWAARSPGHDPTLPLSGVSLMLSFGTMFDADRAKKFDGRIGFRLGPDSYLARIRKGRFKVARAEAGASDVLLTASPTAIAAVVYGGAPLDSVRVEGERSLAEKFITLFPLPAKVA